MGFLDTLTKIGGAINPFAGIAEGIFGWLSGKSQADAQKAYNNMVAQLHNEWLTTRNNEVKGILDELQKRGQDIYGPQVTTQTGTTTGTQAFSETETPTLAPEYQPLAGLQRALVERRLSSPTGMPAGYEQTGIEAINAGAEKARVARESLARSRGISPDLLKIGDPNERARMAQIASFRANLPLQARQLQSEDINLAEAIMQKAIGRKRRGTSSSFGTTTGTTTAPPDYAALAGLLLTPGPKAATM
jgi:hypothetical protein